MFGFDNGNSIEPAAPARPVVARKPDPAEIPIREATPIEMRALLRSRAAPHAAETDAVARRHNLYMGERRSTRIYYTDYQQKSEVMRAAPQRITTRLDDRQTVSAMLDLAQSRGWQSVKLRGTDNFKREAWVQAQVRGLQTEGYQPKATDMQEAQRRTVAATPVAQPAKAPAEAMAASTVGSPAAKATKPATAKTVKPAAASTAKPAAASTAKPAAANAGQAAQKRQATVWGAVETAGHQARQNDAATAKPAQKPAEKLASPPTPAEAA
jgi:hypothetical protein